MQTETLMSREALAKAIDRLADEVADSISNPAAAALVGIRSRGVPLAERVRDRIKSARGWDLPSGALDITLYRDDLSTLGPQPIIRASKLPFDVDGCEIFLFDDVLFTGRTVRAALDELVDYGRPRAIRLAVLVDRGWREYPIQPDFAALKIDTTLEQVVKVCFMETDGHEEVLLVDRNSLTGR